MLWVFVDNAPRAPFLRPHSSNDPGVIRRAREKAAKEGKRSVRLPPCRGAEQRPLELRWPNGEPYFGGTAEVQICWPGGAIYWEGPMGAVT